MKERVYILLDIAGGNTNKAIQVLQNTPGVVAVDVLERPHDMILVLEAAERRQLGEFAIQALDVVGLMIERVEVLPVRAFPLSVCN